MDKSKIVSRHTKLAKKIIFDNNIYSWELADSYPPGLEGSLYYPAQLITMSNGNLRLSVFRGQIINPDHEDKVVTIRIEEYFKGVEDEYFKPDLPTGIYTNQEIIISNNQFCTINDPSLTSIEDRSITHDSEGNLNQGFIGLLTAYRIAFGNSVILDPISAAMGDRCDKFINSA